MNEVLRTKATLIHLFEQMSQPFDEVKSVIEFFLFWNP